MNPEAFIANARFEFDRYKKLADGTMAQLSDTQLYWRASETDNSIAHIVKHLAGNMKSRWTNFLTEDGEKPWRHREREFKDPPKTREELLNLWNEGWDTLFNALDAVDANNFNTSIFIRNEKHTLIAAINRQLGHYAYHVGQIVYLGKAQLQKDWHYQSIPPGKSEAFNKEKMGN